MKCLKCGTAITSGQVFCQTCQDDMERHPVKPGTPIVLPNRPERHVSKSSHKKTRKAEDRVISQRRLIFVLTAIIFALAGALTVTLIMLFTGADPMNLLNLSAG